MEEKKKLQQVNLKKDEQGKIIRTTRTLKKVKVSVKKVKSPVASTVEEVSQTKSDQPNKESNTTTQKSDSQQTKNNKGKILISRKKETGFKYSEGKPQDNSNWYKEKKSEQLAKLKYSFTEDKQDGALNVPEKIEIPETISIKNLSLKLNLKATQVIKRLVRLGVMNLTVNDNIDAESAEIVCNDLGCEVAVVSLLEQTKIKEEVGDEKDCVSRPPIVTIMGHVDHGKTTLLDTIKKTKLVDSESGGITQHIGAYTVSTEKGDLLMIDTPGHAAFSSMRSRGANITDIVIIVVSAMDGIKPQTIESIKKAKKEKAQLIIAINKMDVKGADAQKVKSMLSEHDVAIEEWGGDVPCHEISALQNQGIKELLECVMELSTKMKLTANPKVKSTGFVLETRVEKGRGNIATIIIKNGILKIGDIYICGNIVGKIRAIFNDFGKSIKEATPSMSVEIIGISGNVGAGRLFQVMSSEKEAKKIAERRNVLEKENKSANVKKITLSNIFEKLEEQNIKEKNVIIKGDVFGTVEAIKTSLLELKNDEVKVNVLKVGTGEITESDVNFASTSDASIIAFKIKPSSKVAKFADQRKISIKTYDIIYDIIEDVKESLIKMINVQEKENYFGKILVKNIFKITDIGKIAGCEVIDGKAIHNGKVRVIREGSIVFTGEIKTLKRHQDNVKEVTSGMECGIQINNYQDVKIDDELEIFTTEKVKREITFDTPVK